METQSPSAILGQLQNDLAIFERSMGAMLALYDRIARGAPLSAIADAEKQAQTLVNDFKRIEGKYRQLPASLLPPGVGFDWWKKQLTNAMWNAIMFLGIDPVNGKPTGMMSAAQLLQAGAAKNEIAKWALDPTGQFMERPTVELSAEHFARIAGVARQTVYGIPKPWTYEKAVQIEEQARRAKAQENGRAGAQVKKEKSVPPKKSSTRLGWKCLNGHTLRDHEDKCPDCGANVVPITLRRPKGSV